MWNFFKCAYGISAVKNIFAQMSNHDIAPDSATYNTLMQYIKGQNDFERAILYVDRRSCHVTP